MDVRKTPRRSAGQHTDVQLWLGPEDLQWGAWRAGQCLPQACGSEALAASPDLAPADAATDRHAALVQAVGRLVGHWAALAAEAGVGGGRLRLRVTVADVHLQVATLAWTPLVMREDLLPSLAQAQLVQAGHEPQPGDVLRVGEGPAGQDRCVVAYPQALLDACRGLARELGAELVSVLPLSVQAWEIARPWRQPPGPDRRAGQPAVLGVLVDGMALLSDGGRQLGRSQAQRHAQPATVLRGQWRRRQLRWWARPAEGGVGTLAATSAGVAASRLPVLDLRSEAASTPLQDDAFAVLPLSSPPLLASASAADGCVPSPLLACLQQGPRPEGHALNAVRRAARPAPGWWLAAVAVWLMALLLVVDNGSLWQDRRLAQAAMPRPAQASLALAVPAPAFSREELAQVQQVNEAVRRLNLPIDALLEGLRAPQDVRVAVLSVDIRASTAAGRGASVVRAQAEDGVDMARYVAFVADRAPFVDAHLKQHERREDEAGRPYLFTLEAAWPQ
ncbi:MAG: hypothetical protein IIA02_06920 [Proteobacteria bacterium]|uniref:hypothetical protein n=1 Tax=Aquabacterium sp. TaxID=1872578 RepID=UPI0035C67EEF|nr:hypothetical protein [Pseudomonadota bacterium]